MQLTKHHGLGNDFLVALVPAGKVGVYTAELVRRVCDRHRGVGADGLLIGALSEHSMRHGTLGEDNVDLTMILYNADGQRAEMSGNGIRCLAHAEVRRRGVTAATLRIGTDAGLRVVDVTPGSYAGEIQARLAMGAVAPGPQVPVLGALDKPVVKRAESGDIGNPHIVALVDDPATVDVAGTGSRIEAHVAGGVNVEFIAPRPGEPDAIDLAVWERGVGITQACGTGACVASYVAYKWGLVGPRVVVHMPGGDAVVEVGEQMVLIGPSEYIAQIELA